MNYTRREIIAAFVYLPTINILQQGSRRIECVVEVEPPTPDLLSTFTLFKPNGSQSNETTITNGNGRAVVLFRLKRNDPSGVYNGRVDVTTNNGQVTDQSSVIV